MSDNVYALVNEFYRENSRVGSLLPRILLDKYFRRLAWRGRGDAELRLEWSLLELLLTYPDEQQRESFAARAIFDYQELLYRYNEVHKEFRLEEGPVRDWLKRLQDFYEYLTENGWQEDFAYFIRDVEESLYLDDNFSMPPRHTEGDFYHRLDPEAEDSELEVERLNAELDAVLKSVSQYFRQKKYARDSDRAMRIFCGPAIEVPPFIKAESEVEEDSAFWLSYWDYFMFDYHLLDDDRTPLRHYYELEKDSLSTTAQDILRDLLHARFSVFEVVELQENMVKCRDLFTEEYMDLPMPEVGMDGIENFVFFGHIRTRGILMLNYITSVPASLKLRSRMKEVVLRQYELFKLQSPGASLEQFFVREAAAVRHILHVMSDYAQLNVVSLREAPPLVQRVEGLADAFREESRAMEELVRRIGFSAYACLLIRAFFDDALSVQGDEKSCRRQMPDLMTAVLLLFIRINGYDYTATPDLYMLFGSHEKETEALGQVLQEKLDVRVFDPRYLTEDGVVLSLYLLVQENKQR